SGPCPIMPAGPAVPGFPAPMPASRAKRPTRLLATYTRQALPGDLTAITLCHEHWWCLTIRTAVMIGTPLSNDRFKLRPEVVLRRWVVLVLGQVLACLAHWDACPVGGGAD